MAESYGSGGVKASQRETPQDFALTPPIVDRSNSYEGVRLDRRERLNTIMACKAKRREGQVC